MPAAKKYPRQSDRPCTACGEYFIMERAEKYINSRCPSCRKSNAPYRRKERIVTCYNAQCDKSTVTSSSRALCDDCKVENLKQKNSARYTKRTASKWPCKADYPCKVCGAEFFVERKDARRRVCEKCRTDGKTGKHVERLYPCAGGCGAEIMGKSPAKKCDNCRKGADKEAQRKYRKAVKSEYERPKEVKRHEVGYSIVSDPAKVEPLPKGHYMTPDQFRFLFKADALLPGTVVYSFLTKRNVKVVEEKKKRKLVEVQL